MNPNLKVQTVTLAANGVTPVSVTGSFLVLQSSTGSFNFSIDGGAFQPGLTVLTIDLYRDLIATQALLPGGAPKLAGLSTVPAFKELLFLDTSGAPNAITIITANGIVGYYAPPATVFAKDAPTYTKGTALGAMLAAASSTFSGVDSGKSRKQIIVTNNDATLVVAVTDNAGVRIGDVYPQRAWTLATSGVVKVVNQNGGNLTGTVDVGETFYS